MTLKKEEKDKNKTEEETKVSVSATLQTTTHMIRGKVHVRRDQRIKDELDLNESFLAITDVTVLGAEGQTLFQAPFLTKQHTHNKKKKPKQKQDEERTS